MIKTVEAPIPLEAVPQIGEYLFANYGKHWLY